MADEALHVLLIDDDEDDYVVTRDLLGRIYPSTVVVDWESSFESGQKAIERDDHDVCLVDYRLGQHTGLELLRHAGQHHVHAPVIMLTGVSDRVVDSDVLAAGAADYLVKGEFGPSTLERSIRYAMERKRHQDELERSNEILRATEREVSARMERETLVNRIAQTLRSSLDPDAIQSAAAGAIGEALKADRCYFARFDIQERCIRIANDWHRADLSTVAGKYRLSSRRFTQLVDTHRNAATVVIDDVDAFNNAIVAVAIHTATPPKALIRVPLLAETELSALMCVETLDIRRRWEPAEVSLVETIAALARSAIAVANARQRELQIATTLQQTLLPLEVCSVPGLDIGVYYKPAMTEANVGGDFCDVFSLSTDRFALVIGDVSGKGLIAASQVATIRDMLRCALYLENTLINAVNKLNQILTKHNLINGFATLFVGIFDSNTRTLEYVSCNLEPMLILRGDPARIDEIAPSGPPISMTYEIRYDESTMSLAGGDALLLFTDGLSEAGPDRDHMLQTDGVKELFAARYTPDIDAKRLVGEIAEDAIRYALGVVRDDICVLSAILRPRDRSPGTNAETAPGMVAREPQ
jgi:DNA-binding response OmpR family regulator